MRMQWRYYSCVLWYDVVYDSGVWKSQKSDLVLVLKKNELNLPEFSTKFSQFSILFTKTPQLAARESCSQQQMKCKHIHPS